jgi:pimeloyl-ACP methyl ester carboxylesterase
MKRLAMVILLAASPAHRWGAAASPAPEVRQGGADREIVILLHGLARSSRSMAPMERALTHAGYDVRLQQYPSTEKTVEEIVRDHLVPLIAQCQSEHPAKIHFVTHSLGGILLRYYFAHHSQTNIGRIVMLGPPNQGSEVVDKLGHFSLFDWINGPAGQQLGTASNALPRQLPVPPTEIGVIAGTQSINLILSTLIPGPDDGKVGVEHTKLDGMKDFATVSASHPFLMRDREVIAKTLSFLRTGRFDPPETAP